MIARGALAPRRAPAPADRYRHAVHEARARLPQRRRLPFAAAAVLWAFLLVGAGTMAVRAASGVAHVAGNIGSFVADLIPPATAVDIPVADSSAPVAIAPILDPTPDFVAAPALLLQGRVPSFAASAGRQIEATLNNGSAVTAPIDANGHFALPLTLKEGPNAILVAIVAGRDTIATTSRTIVLDRLPPVLTLTRPKAGDIVDGPNVTVEGKTEPYATVTVNDRSVVVGSDGTFSETFTAPFGPVAITVVARDRAGNEARSVATVVARAKALGASLTLFVALDKPVVRPGDPVVATITLSDPSGPRADTTVTLSVGVVPIGTARTDKLGKAAISFAAPPHEAVAQVVVLGGGVFGSATLTVTR